MTSKMRDKTRADLCLDAVNVAINHAMNFAPNSPIERFLAQEIAGAKAEVYEEAGWSVSAGHWQAAIEQLREMDITTRLALAGPSELATLRALLKEAERVLRDCASDTPWHHTCADGEDEDSCKVCCRRLSVSTIHARLSAALKPPASDSNAPSVDGMAGDVSPLTPDPKHAKHISTSQEQKHEG